jgi:DNA primase
MSEFSNQLKVQADLAALIGEHVKLRPGGNGFVGLCPFHGERTPSFHIHTARRFYYCFGCHAHGDIFQFLMELRKISFSEAVELVAERLGVAVPKGAADDASGDSAERRDLLRVHAAAAEFYAGQLAAPAGAEARAYLQERDVPPAAWARFQLGYAPESGRGLAAWLESHGFAAALALRGGLCQWRRESADRAAAADRSPNVTAGPAWSDLYDRFRHRLMIPIGDERGRVIAFGGRALGPADPSGRTPKYLNSPEHPLYVKGRVLYNLDRAREPIRQLGYSILVEGYFDCLRVSLAGFENVVASCGTALTAAQIVPLARLSRKAAINFDPDSAGAAAAERSIGLLLEEGFQMRVVTLEPGLDPDLFLRRRGREAYAQALKSSRSFFDFLAARAARQFDLRRGEGKVAAVNHLLPYLSHVHDPILRQSLAENLAAQLGLDQPLISRQLLQAARRRQTELPAPAFAAPVLLSAERALLRAWIDQPQRRAGIEAQVAADGLLQGLASEALWQQLCAASAGRPEAGWREWVADLDAADRHLLADVLMGADAGVDGAVEEALDVLRERRGAQAMRKLQAGIQQAAAAGDREVLQALLREKAAWDARNR